VERLSELEYNASRKAKCVLCSFNEKGAEIVGLDNSHRKPIADINVQTTPKNHSELRLTLRELLTNVARDCRRDAEAGATEESVCKRPQTMVGDFTCGPKAKHHNEA